MCKRITLLLATLASALLGLPTLGVTVLVDNKPGASAILGTLQVVRAPADGRTLPYANARSNETFSC